MQTTFISWPILWLNLQLHHIAPNYKIIHELQRVWKEAVVASSFYCCKICLDELRKKKRNTLVGIAGVLSDNRTNLLSNRNLQTWSQRRSIANLVLRNSIRTCSQHQCCKLAVWLIQYEHVNMTLYLPCSEYPQLIRISVSLRRSILIFSACQNRGTGVTVQTSTTMCVETPAEGRIAMMD